ncbi:MAG: hypothetical protein KC561_18735, partial [Myxococcales bacterium]|nr:hypothetical protein [Myxococcales bacterium]
EVESGGVDLFAAGRALIHASSSLPPGFVAGSNAAFDLSSIIDGALVFFHANTNQYDEDGYRSMVAMADRFLDGKTFIAAHYSGAGTSWSYDYDPEETAEMVVLDARVADGVVVWNLPNSLYYLASLQGIFSERTSHSGAFNLLAFWPQDQTAYPGWYQRWDSAPLGSGVQTIEIYDRDDEYADVRLLLNGDPSQVFYRDSQAGELCTATDATVRDCPGLNAGLSCTYTCRATTQVVEITLPTSTDTVSIDVSFTGTFGDKVHWLFFNVQDATQWTFSTGVEYEFEELYVEYLSAITSLQSDGDGDGTVDCNDACPSDPLKVEEGLCGCGAPDIDSDGDGVVDCIDECPSIPMLTEAHPTCGCDPFVGDSDHDGTPDCADACPTDPNRTELGICPCGQTLKFTWLGSLRCVPNRISTSPVLRF